MTLQLKPFDPTILRSNDIRGIVGDDLTPDTAYTIGRLMGLKAKTWVVGFDGRPSSPIFAEALVEGLVQAGAHVTQIGLGPTPMTYFAERHLKADASIMVTGSHNPAEYNGFKITVNAKPFWGGMIKALEAEVATCPSPEARGTAQVLDIKETYINRLMQDFTAGRNLRVAWDPGNGAVGAVLPELIAKLPGEHTVIYGEVDGTFPNHHPDPTVDENLNDLRKLVVTGKYDCGIAFDGDGDRIGVIANDGTIIRGDTLLALYAAPVLAKHQGASIVADVKCSSLLFSEIKRMGGVPVMEKTGHAAIKDRIAKTNAPLAGEFSCHVFFNDTYYGFDDAPYAAIRLLNIAGQNVLSDLLATMPQSFATPEIRIDIAERDKTPKMQGLVEGLSAYAATQNNWQVTTLDGVRLDTPDGWVLVRASSTTASLIGRVEATSQKRLLELQQLLQTYLNKYDLTMDMAA